MINVSSLKKFLEKIDDDIEVKIRLYDDGGPGEDEKSPMLEHIIDGDGERVVIG